MPKLTFTISKENDNRIREIQRTKGDISELINNALDLYLTPDNIKILKEAYKNKARGTQQ